MTPAARDVLTRAGKTTGQTLLSTAAIAYARYQANPHGTLLWPGILAGATSAGAGGVSVLWNGSSTLMRARKAKKVAVLAQAINDAVLADRAARAATLPQASAPTP